MDEHGRLVRRPEDGMIAGVAAGIAERYDVDVTLVRLGFIVLAIISAGLAVVVYLAAAVLMPRDDAQVGTESVKHGVTDLVSRGKELYGEGRKVVDRTRGRSAQQTEAGVRPSDISSHEF